MEKLADLGSGVTQVTALPTVYLDAAHRPVLFVMMCDHDECFWFCTDQLLNVISQ